MEHMETSCVECEHQITNPICPDCLAQDMRAWIAEVSPEMVMDVDGFSMDGDVSCLFCHQSISICAHCYSKDVYEQLALKDKKLAREFMARFDFDLRKELMG
jgi:hypothetical protein